MHIVGADGLLCEQPGPALRPALADLLQRRT
jgi:hypothetical protein